MYIMSNSGDINNSLGISLMVKKSQLSAATFLLRGAMKSDDPKSNWLSSWLLFAHYLVGYQDALHLLSGVSIYTYCIIKSMGDMMSNNELLYGFSLKLISTLLTSTTMTQSEISLRRHRMTRCRL
jgi:hypothetical protein